MLYCIQVLFLKMIRIFLGNIGSGKTACAVREMMISLDKRKTYSNIETKKVPKNIVIKKEMIIKKELIKIKRNGEEVFKKSFNVDFWKGVVEKEKSINVILDEAHTLINSRRAMSTINRIMGDFLALLRRIIGSNSSGYGTLTLITQLERRLDVNAREMATNVRFHVCHYNLICKNKNCNFKLIENNETAEKTYICPFCNSELIKCNHIIEVWEFRNMNKFNLWFEGGYKSYFKHYYIHDIELVFPHYNTLQWDNLISDD